MNIFTTDAFLETAGASFFPGRKHRIEVCRLAGQRLRLLVLDGHEVVGRMPFYDFPQPLDDAQGPVDREIFHLPRTVLRTVELHGEPHGKIEGTQPSPYIEWKKHGSWAEWEAAWKANPLPKSFDGARQRRKLERDVGPIRFELDDTRPAVFDACVQWKSSQYVASGFTDMFANPRHVSFFKRLRDRGVLLVSSLCAGDSLLAVHFGSLNDQRFGWWIPTYDPKFARFSPGRILLDELMKASFARGDLEFDFLIGDENYKFLYATHNRVIGAVGTPPLKEVLFTKAKATAKALLSMSPRALELARSLQKKLATP